MTNVGSKGGGKEGDKRRDEKGLMVQASGSEGTPWCLGENKPILQEKKQKIKTAWRKRKMERIRNFFKDESGATMVEYGLMVALIAVVCIGIVQVLGTNLRDNAFIPARDAVGGAGG
jgi:pilus assembly protein Flp/PilA